MLDVRDVSIRIPTEDGTIHAARNVSFRVERGQLFGIAGESGSGKSVLTQAIMGLLPTAEISGQAVFEGRDLLSLGPREMRDLRGRRIGMIFQDPLSSLHPYYTIGSQIAEAIRAHERVGRGEARERVVDVLGRVGIPQPEKRAASYPHQFSGGMRQRVMIAMALVLRPALVIADEPTTALDVTVQAQILALLDDLRREEGTTVIMITHDLSLLSTIADEVMVMYAGNRMEVGPAHALFSAPTHPYTAGLLRSSPAYYVPGSELVPVPGRPPSLLDLPKGCVYRPRCGEAMEICASPPPSRVFDDGTRSLCWLERPVGERVEAAPAPPTGAHTGAGGRDAEGEVAIRGRALRLAYKLGSATIPVLDGIDIELRRGETLGLVGESGCGKSTLARVLCGLVPPTSGSVELSGRSIGSLSPTQWRETRRRIQLVFQDPFGSLNPRRRVSAIIGDPFRIHGLHSGTARTKAVQGLMEKVGLNPEHYNRFPSEFSGGQRQRIGIARALALNPDVIVFDEPVSALDVSIQAQVLNLMRQLQTELGLTYLFISHDLAVVRHVCNRIAVMNKGRIVELADAERIYTAPQTPYTRDLIAASLHARPLASGQARRLVETIAA